MEALQLTTHESPARAAAPQPTAGLLQAAAQGDGRAFELIVSTYRQRVLRQCLRRGLNMDEAEDVTQDVFISVYRNLHRYQHQNTFSTWLYRITENACIDLCRRRKRRNAVMQPMPTDADGNEHEPAGHIADPDAQLTANELGRRIAEELQSLSPLIRNAFEMKELEGLRYDQIAKRLGVTVGTVKSRIFRARQLLTQRLADLV
jgi:RNA polymerase sigma-70 factor, ECF subfamily